MFGGLASALMQHWLRTFINALELSPVHWLKFLPCLNWRKPGKGGASAIL